MTIKNEEVIEDYIKKHQNDLYRFAYSYVKNSEDALDIVQDSIYKALKNSNSLRDQSKVKTWLFTIIRNTSYTFFKNRREDISLTLVQEEGQLEKISKTEKLYLKALVEGLDKESQELIRLRFYEALQFDEIAEILNLNINTVKSRFYKVLDIIRDEYERSG